MKICNKCKVQKTKAEFSKDKLSKDGISPECKDCYSKRYKLYRLKNLEKINSRMSIYRIENAESARKRTSEYRIANPEKIAENNRKRRAMKRGANGSHTAKDVMSIFCYQRGLCANCETKLFKSGKKKFHVDHIMPLSKGGGNGPDNLQCLCPTCNIRKNAKDPIDWANENGRLL